MILEWEPKNLSSQDRQIQDGVQDGRQDIFVDSLINNNNIF